MVSFVHWLLVVGEEEVAFGFFYLHFDISCVDLFGTVLPWLTNIATALLREV